MDFELDVIGLDDVVRGLRRVEQRTAVKEIRAAVRQGAKPMIASAKARVPYDGNEDADGYSLRDSIKLRSEKKRNRSGTQVQFRLGPQRETAGPGDPPGYAISGGLGPGIGAPNYAQLIEEETPFLEPAFDSNFEDYLRRFAVKLGGVIEAPGLDT